jgi:hypothetical protein
MGLLWATHNLREFLLGKAAIPEFFFMKSRYVTACNILNSSSFFTISAEPSHV